MKTLPSTLFPDGDYILRVDYAADNDYVEIPNPPNTTPRTRTEAHPLHYYRGTDLPIRVDADLSGVMVAVARTLRSGESIRANGPQALNDLRFWAISLSKNLF